MIIVDNALRKLEAEGRVISVAIVGAGMQARALARSIEKSTPGMRVVAVANRSRGNAETVFSDLGLTPTWCTTPQQITETIAAGGRAVTTDPTLFGPAEGIDAVVESTGALEFSAHAVLAAIEGGKHPILVNAELDATIGPVLKAKADAMGLTYTAGDGDQPGVAGNLLRFVEGIGVRPVLAGSIKGLHDPYRNPETQVSFAAKWGMLPSTAASFADGTKISIEQALMANSRGWRVARRGMTGPDFSGGDPYAPLVPLDEAVKALFPVLDEHLAAGATGIVDYVIGARPNPGVFVLGMIDDPVQQHQLAYYKLGPGPYYLFYVPYHLCHFEVPSSIARAVLFGDAVLAPSGAPTVGVVAVAKKDLQPGETIAELGGFECYGMLENIEVMRADDLIPLGLAIGGKVNKPIAKDTPITFADVDRPAGRLIDTLHAEQEAMFSAPVQEDVA
ncbi:NAD(P)H-dependent oxidoreductase [Paenirhodobacter populi]|uniref:NAD(P)-dependent oxidoreductase n=1 Tax=Paenirhodobacter populi TaxID=2306993 RepID=A0A443JNT7_9RHOB|nr:SAF domain-containing protein [Sinirhodobacter populi]RWR22144.1 NAD(P)-dependent oxidoreductase [Sinirhodobacter populi]